MCDRSSRPLLKVRSTSTDVAKEIVKMNYKRDTVTNTYLEYKGSRGPFERDEDKWLSLQPTNEGVQAYAQSVLTDNE
jgi:hypothetical protein